MKILMPIAMAATATLGAVSPAQARQGCGHRPVQHRPAPAFCLGNRARNKAAGRRHGRAARPGQPMFA